MTESTRDLDEVFDGDGFLQDPHLWNAAMAERIATSGGIERLTEAHWKVIEYLRQHYLQNATLPVERLVCHHAGLDEGCLQRLFNQDMRMAWRIAGLPNPGEEAKTYM